MTVEHENPREFYWALMDYGSHLKTTVGNAARASKHYTKQSTFKGSKRQIRGQVLRVLGAMPTTLSALQVEITDERLPGVLTDLQAEGLIHLRADGAYYL
jgi:A/G-specific adenine glycosylase